MSAIDWREPLPNVTDRRGSATDERGRHWGFYASPTGRYEVSSAEVKAQGRSAGGLEGAMAVCTKMYEALR